VKTVFSWEDFFPSFFLVKTSNRPASWTWSSRTSWSASKLTS
jgi:hypothetical protein